MVSLRTGEVYLVKLAYSQSGFGYFRAQFAEQRNGSVAFRNCQALVRQAGEFKVLMLPDQVIQEANPRQVVICTPERAPDWFIMEQQS